MPNRKRRRMQIRIKRRQQAKRKKTEGCKRVVERHEGRKKVRFLKPVSA